MEKKFKIITLCGSTKFKKEFIENQQKLAMEGNIVLSLDFFEKSEPYAELEADEIQHLQEIHNEKIKISDAIFVINVGGYIGKSTKKEIEYAKSLNKEIVYLEDINKIKIFCPFCKYYSCERDEKDIKDSTRIYCMMCKRSIVLNGLLI